MSKHRSLSSLFPALVFTAAFLYGCTATPVAGTTASIAASAWAVNTAQSNLNFVTTKAGQPGVGGIDEVQSFKSFSGGLSAQGQIRLAIDLTSVKTGVDIRDERIQNMFGVKLTPQAVFTAQLAPAALEGLNRPGVQNIEVQGQLSIAGQTKPATALLQVTRLGANQLSVATRSPIVINAADFGLRAGVEAMREVMGLNFLSSSAPVTFNLLLSAGT
jgi:polyisoprenoid-binding protein YceI